MKLGAELVFKEACRELESGKRVAVPVAGGSMRPFLQPGDRVVLERRLAYDVDDILLAMTDCGVIMHALMPDGCLMGTANLSRREHPVVVAGCVVAVERGSRTIDATCRSWRVKMAIWRILLPVRKLLVKFIDRS